MATEGRCGAPSGAIDICGSKGARAAWASGPPRDHHIGIHWLGWSEIIGRYHGDSRYTKWPLLSNHPSMFFSLTICHYHQVRPQKMVMNNRGKLSWIIYIYNYIYTYIYNYIYNYIYIIIYIIIYIYTGPHGFVRTFGTPKSHGLVIISPI